MINKLSLQDSTTSNSQQQHQGTTIRSGSNNRSSSTPSTSHRTIHFNPTLSNSKDSSSSEALTITCSKRIVKTAAVSFCHSALIHTQLEIRKDNTSAILIRITDLDPTAPTLPPNSVSRALWNALFCYFVNGLDSPESYNIELPLPSLILHSALISIGAKQFSPHYHLTKSVIFQLYSFAFNSTISIPFPYLINTSTDNISHPLRPPQPNSINPIYSRLIPHLDHTQYFKLNICNNNDLIHLHPWLNDTRVNEFWQEKGTWEQHEIFLKEKLLDNHVLPVIGSYVVQKENETTTTTSTTAATYSEIYWVKEDRLGKLLGENKVDDYDRGIHVLVGSTNHRGPHRVRAWLPSLVHYCFLDDIRTQKVFAEPNQLNSKMITYFESVGFVRHGEVEFPHKTAALMICERNDFYNKCPF